jgi:predicted nucleic acid-binding protein
MKVFIDTNILLDIYHLSGPDLEELRKLRKMVEKEKVELLVSQQVLDEFWRNRERVIADAMKNFRDSKAAAKIPNIIRAYPESKDLREAVDKVNAIVRQLGEKANADIEADSLKADEVVRELFSVIKVGEITSEIVQRARLRSDIGNPPGKRDSIGDAINWEWLLEQDVDFWDRELVLISADGDYESELTKGKPKEFLLREWNTRNPDCQLVLDKSLPEFFQREFPDIQLAEEIDKLEAIERLERSGSFAATHSAIAMLLQYDDFKDSELQRILAAYLSNNQIQWILGDSDVKSFAAKVADLSKERRQARWLHH